MQLHGYSRWLTVTLVFAALPLLAQQTPYVSPAPTLPATLQAENFDKGGQTVSWYDDGTGNAFFVPYRTDGADVDIGQIAAGQYHIGAIAATEWVEYTVNVAATAAFSMTIRYSSGLAGGASYRLLLASASGMPLLLSDTAPSTGAWTTYTSRPVPGQFTLGAGTHVLRLVFDGGAFNPDWLQFTSCTAPTARIKTFQPPNPSTSFTFESIVTGTGPFTYEWFKNTGTGPVKLIGKTGATLTLENVEHGTDAGAYTVRVTNACGQATSAAANLRVWCGASQSPDWTMENIHRAFTGGVDYCDWRSEMNTGFPDNFGDGGSYNLPPLAAATAFIREPIRTVAGSAWNMEEWWTKYLQGELGLRPPGTWFYGGQELGSFEYQSYNILAVMAVHQEANRLNKHDIRNLAARWLRATFALHAMAAVPSQPVTLHAKGQQHNPNSPYVGPYILMAGERSPWGFWVDPDRMILFGRATGLSLDTAGEEPHQKRLRAYIEQVWVPKTANENSNAYGLTFDDQNALKTAVTSNSVPAGLFTRFVPTSLRTWNTYHIVSWDGVKATLMERNTIKSTAPTYGVAYFQSPRSAGGREAHFLYPWQGMWVFNGNRLHRNGITLGHAWLDLPGRVMGAQQPGSTQHMQETVQINNLPLSSAIRFRLTLTETQPPRLCNPNCP